MAYSTPARSTSLKPPNAPRRKAARPRRRILNASRSLKSVARKLFRDFAEVADSSSSGSSTPSPLPSTSSSSSPLRSLSPCGRPLARSLLPATSSTMSPSHVALRAVRNASPSASSPRSFDRSRSPLRSAPTASSMSSRSFARSRSPLRSAPTAFSMSSRSLVRSRSPMRSLAASSMSPRRCLSPSLPSSLRDPAVHSPLSGARPASYEQHTHAAAMHHTMMPLLTSLHFPQHSSSFQREDPYTPACSPGNASILPLGMAPLHAPGFTHDRFLASRRLPFTDPHSQPMSRIFSSPSNSSVPIHEAESTGADIVPMSDSPDPSPRQCPPPSHASVLPALRELPMLSLPAAARHSLSSIESPARSLAAAGIAPLASIVAHSRMDDGPAPTSSVSAPLTPKRSRSPVAPTSRPSLPPCGDDAPRSPPLLNSTREAAHLSVDAFERMMSSQTRAEAYSKSNLRAHKKKAPSAPRKRSFRRRGSQPTLSFGREAATDAGTILATVTKRIAKKRPASASSTVAKSHEAATAGSIGRSSAPRQRLSDFFSQKKVRLAQHASMK